MHLDSGARHYTWMGDSTYVVCILFRSAHEVERLANRGVHDLIELGICTFLWSPMSARIEMKVERLIYPREATTHLDFDQFISGHPEHSLANIVETLEPRLAGVVRDRHRDHIPV